ncbi:MAG: AAA family ATPase [Thermodesulfobacteriota bacterium]|nr:AAA family ATPase [Thermodesulfobacteriota bacterium]
MYTKYYGLDRTPFDLTPDPRVVYMSEAHQEALAVLRYGVIARKGFLLLTGDVGTGKTTLLQLLVQSIDSKIHICLIVNPALSASDFYYYLAAAYGLPEYDGNKAKFLLNFVDFLQDCRSKNERVLLVIDEAHVVSLDLLEEIRLLSNQDDEDVSVMSIFLVGQPELNDRLNHERLLPLRQRVGIRFHLTPFSNEETRNYILFRLRKGGARRLDLFTSEAVDLIYRESGGTPRLINTICDHALLSGFSESKPRITADIVKECVDELQIPGEKNLSVSDRTKQKKKDMRWLLVVFFVVAVFLAVWGFNQH